MSLGFDPAFLPFPVALPQPEPAIAGDLADAKGFGSVLPYTHFSLAVSKSRRLARWVAWNIDGLTRLTDISREGQGFRADPRLPDSAQTLEAVYTRNRLDRGHLARRADLLWGSRADAEKANHDSFYFTNITPQMDDFNQSAKNGVWGRLENALLEVVDRQQATVLAGPVLADDDPPYRGVRVPREFWKLLAYQLNGRPRVRVFLVTQSLVLNAALDPFAAFETYAITMDELHERTQLRFPTELGTHFVVEETCAAEPPRQPIRRASDIVW